MSDNERIFDHFNLIWFFNLLQQYPPESFHLIKMTDEEISFIKEFSFKLDKAKEIKKIMIDVIDRNNGYFNRRLMFIFGSETSSKLWVKE